MTPDRILIEWTGPTGKGAWRADLASYERESAAALVAALALASFELRSLAKRYELQHMDEPAQDAQAKADELQQLVDAMRAEG